MDSGVEYYTYYVVIEIKNVSSNTDYVLNAYLDTLATSEISEIVSNANGDTDVVNISSGNYSNIVIGFSYKGNDKTKNEEFNYTLNIEYVESGPELSLSISNTLSYNGSNSIKDRMSIAVTKYTEKINYLSDEKTNAILKPASNFRARAKAIESGELTLSGGTKIGDYSIGDSFDITAEFNNNVSVVWIVYSVTSTTAYDWVNIIDGQELDFYTANCFIYRSFDVQLASNVTQNIVFGYTLNGLNPNVSSLDLSYTLIVAANGFHRDQKNQSEYTRNGETVESYNYFEQGDFYGLPIRWRIIAGYKSSSTDTSATVTFDGVKYKKSDELGGVTRYYGICIQETNTSAYYTERADGQMLSCCSFNNYSGNYKYDESGAICSGVYANDYGDSKIDCYFSGSDIGKYSSGSQNNSNGHTSNFLTDLNIGADSSSTGIYLGMHYMISSEDYGFFWLLSSEEILLWLANVTSTSSWSGDVNTLLKWRYYEGDTVKSTKYWLRSVSSTDYSHAYYVGSNGECCEGTVNSFDISVRPACIVTMMAGGSK